MSHAIATPFVPTGRAPARSNKPSAVEPASKSGTPPLTGWLSAAVNPAHEGVYERRRPAGPYSCFSADRWFGDAATPAAAAVSRIESSHTSAAWRGLTTPPAFPCGTCRGHTVIDRGVDAESGVNLIDDCPDC